MKLTEKMATTARIYHKYNELGSNLGLNNGLSNHPKGLGPRNNKPYFFVPNENLHLRFTKDGSIVCYTVRPVQVFSTLEEFARAYGIPLSDIRYGFEIDSINFGSLSIPELMDILYPQNHVNELAQMFQNFGISWSVPDNQTLVLKKSFY
jgi:hypothetical protein